MYCIYYLLGLNYCGWIGLKHNWQYTVFFGTPKKHSGVYGRAGTGSDVKLSPKLQAGSIHEGRDLHDLLAHL